MSLYIEIFIKIFKKILLIKFNLKKLYGKYFYLFCYRNIYFKIFKKKKYLIIIIIFNCVDCEQKELCMKTWHESSKRKVCVKYMSNYIKRQTQNV